mgnify:CR=1 FL=1
MKNNVNFQQKLDEKLEEITRSNQTPTLLLHVVAMFWNIYQNFSKSHCFFIIPI